MRFDQQVTKLLGDSKRTFSIMHLWKEMNGISVKKIYFIGPSVVAKYWWCAMYSAIDSKYDEVASFNQLLEAVLFNAYQAQIVNELPGTNEELVQLFYKLSPEILEELFRSGRAHSMKNRSTLSWRYSKEDLIQMAETETDPMDRGILLEAALAEDYPTMSWGTEWQDFLLVGEPDGITEKFVYEFKTTTFVPRMKSIAFVQADLYGLIFNREKKRIQIHSVEDHEMHTWDENVDIDKAQFTLRAFKSIFDGEPAIPPKEWKCKQCKYLKICPLKRNAPTQLSLL